MNIRIELIGYLAKSGLPNGYKGGELEVEDGTTVEHLLKLLQVQKERYLLIAVNDRVPEETRVLQDGDVVQFAPPLAGGREKKVLG